jgi:hypothetical protein
MDAECFETVVRLCYRAQWSEAEEAATHWVDFAKTSDPATESWDRLGRAQRALLPFVRLRPSSRTLELAPGTAFRHLVEAAEGDDLAAALEALADALEQSADRFATSEQVRAAMETILGPVRSSLARGGNPVDVDLGFLVHGGSLFGVLRTLETATFCGWCEGFLDEQIRVTRPAVVVALGKEARARLSCEDERALWCSRGASISL